MTEDTICAIATPMGEGGIGVIRISGPKAAEIAKDVFRPRSGGVSHELKPRQMSYGWIVNDLTNPGRATDNSYLKGMDPQLPFPPGATDSAPDIIDEAMICYFKAPASYTAEDVVEIQCHGSAVSLRKILSLVIAKGARLAEPGEFTKRAFLNGRLDLSQAEAVMDLIKARTDKTYQVALDQLEGSFSKGIRAIRADITDILVDMAVNIDYPDEDIEGLTYEKLGAGLEAVESKVERYLGTCGTGKILRDGLRVSIIGKPNVGKSSLLNALLREERAIVTDIAGTTRDTIEETVSVDGLPVILTDTAGIRDTDNVIEKIGVERSKDAFNRADLVIFTLDLTRPLDEEDLDIAEKLEGRKVIVFLNKEDAAETAEAGMTEQDISRLRDMLPGAVFVEGSAREDSGLNELRDCIKNIVYKDGSESQSGDIVTNVRHEGLLRDARDSIRDALVLTRSREPLEL
ncbi:MAG: tRNA uridine-5-carboxymethylaminomethyl(34) synthesis GTPase MnmE, partial [Firmicutes bacterium]|nr:tRNA uridine-5-carboxymethylaminomethyl(34) synthesis GTPase MnmE [Bacillota bacterium]